MRILRFRLSSFVVRCRWWYFSMLVFETANTTCGILLPYPLAHRIAEASMGVTQTLLGASDEEVVEAARKTHAHEFITQIEEGHDSLVGERGVKLSGGQRQCIAIARVILKNAPILILDEAISALNSITEHAIQKTLDTAMRGKTVIVVAHRVSTITHLDRILAFDKGRIIEDGTHAELLAGHGAYHHWWSRQAGGLAALSLSAGQVLLAGRKSAPDDEANGPAPLV